MKIDPRLRKFFCFGLMGCGALAVMSAVVNIVGAWKLIDASTEESLGITRNEIAGTYAVIALVGGVMIYLGLRWRK